MADRYLTVVFRNPSDEQVEQIMASENWCALARSHALDEKGMLEDFVRSVSEGELTDPSHEAQLLMNQMGWA